MKLLDTYRDPKTRRCSPYHVTINRLENAFFRLGLRIHYQFRQFSNDCSLYSSTIILDDLNFISNGKGFSSEQAKASAFAEMAERISAGLSFHKSLSGELGGPPITPEEKLECFAYLNNYSYSNGVPTDNALSIGELLSDYLEPDQMELVQESQVARHWVNGYSLNEDSDIMVPLSLIKSISGTNGLASGNVIEEAIIHGSNEVFERYVMRTILTNNMELPSIDPNSISESGLSSILDFLSEEGIDVIIKDCSLGGTFPCIGAVLVKRSLEKASELKKCFMNQRQFRIGASFSPEEALMRCLTEYAQGYILSNIWDSEELWKEWFSLKKKRYIPPRNIWSALKFGCYSGNISFLRKGKTRDYEFHKYSNTGSLMEEISYIKEICEIIEKRLIIVDHTHPIINFPCVRVIIPGVSDIIPFFNGKADVSKLASFKGLNAEDNLFERFIENSEWIESQMGISNLINAIEARISAYPIIDRTCTSGRYNRILLFQELLSSLYLKMGDLRSFSLATKFLGRIDPSKDEFYCGLRELADLGKIEELNKIMELSNGCMRFLVSKPSRNPFLTWCDESCDAKCSERYEHALRKLVESFF